MTAHSMTAISGYLPGHYSASQSEASPQCPGSACPHRGCEGCGAQWLAGRGEPSRDLHHCGQCHLSFSSESAFDRHQHRGQCLPPPFKGLEVRRRGDLDVWGWAVDVRMAALYTPHGFSGPEAPAPVSSVGAASEVAA
jgi:hypothetical protein